MLQLLALVSLFAYTTQVMCVEENNTAQEEYLKRFEAAKKDIDFCCFVKSFTQKSEGYENPCYDLPSRHLDCADLYQKQIVRMKEVQNDENEARLRFMHKSSEQRDFCESLLFVVSWIRSRPINKALDTIRTLRKVQEQVRADLAGLRPIYQRCKKLSAQEQDKCLDTMKLDLYNIYTNYLKTEKRLITK